MSESIEYKICKKCLKTKPVTEFYRHKKERFQRHCKECHRVDVVDFQKTEKGRAICHKAIKKYTLLNPEKKYAQGVVQEAARTGKIPRISSLKCFLCSNKAIHYHHPDYSIPLYVIPVCRACHVNIHKTRAREQK
jgi:hypothetical protein